MKTAFYYVSGFCDFDHYRGLYPVVYQQDREKGPYQKVEMGCTKVAQGKCDKKHSCSVLYDADDILNITEEWKLYDKRIGE